MDGRCPVSSVLALLPLVIVAAVFSEPNLRNWFLPPSLQWKILPPPFQLLPSLRPPPSPPPPPPLEAEENNSQETQKLHHPPPLLWNASSSSPSPISSVLLINSQPYKDPTDGLVERDIATKISKTESSLARARSAIREASLHPNQTSILDADYTPKGPIYRNPHAFHRSYIEMDRAFKIYVYEEGEPPLVHNGPCKSIYSAEGLFIHAMENGTPFRTTDPDEADVFFLPFSVVSLVQYLYVADTFDASPMVRFVADYIDVISNKHGYWDRNAGKDHFMLSCHDWAPKVSYATPNLYHNSIRVLCNANKSEGFDPSKDATLPEIHLVSGGKADVGGPPASKRSIPVFFAGGMHGWIRKLLLQHWKGKDPDVLVYEYLPNNLSYDSLMKKSKFCLCPSGYEVASPRVVEAIYAECVRVIISESYVLPFSDVLNWDAFSIQVPVWEIGNLKKILTGISRRRYMSLQRRLKVVQRHFVVNSPPKRYDVFHMILHSVWLRRLNQRPHALSKALRKESSV